MLERSHDPCFLLEALSEHLVMQEFRRQHLERHDPIERRFVGSIHRGHPALAEDGLNPEWAERGTGRQAGWVSLD